jgi:hypothetical protein
MKRHIFVFLVAVSSNYNSSSNTLCLSLNLREAVSSPYKEALRIALPYT